MRDALSAALLPAGLNVVGVASVAAWDAVAAPGRKSRDLLPGARSIVVVANGGGAMWDAFCADLAHDPAGLTDEPHPVDAFARSAVLRADAALGHVRRRWFWTSADTDVHLDFRVLAHLAGLGVQSRMGLLLHPVYGTWIGLRAACFVAADLGADAPGGPDACDGCPAPCVTACPAGAFASGKWDVDPCGAFHVTSEACRDTCHARVACPAGAAHRYSDAQLHYHYDRPNGRRWLRAHLGIEGDPHEGVGPHWEHWRGRVDVAR